MSNESMPDTDSQVEEGEVVTSTGFCPDLISVAAGTASLVVIAWSSAIANALVGLVILRRPRAITGPEVLSLNLALADFLICVLVVPFVILLQECAVGEQFIVVFSTVAEMLILDSLYILVTIAFERYHSVCKPFEPALTVGRTRFIAVVCFVVASVVATMTPILKQLELMFPSEMVTVRFIKNLPHVFVCLVLLGFFYFRIYLVVHQRAKGIGQGDPFQRLIIWFKSIGDNSVFKSCLSGGSLLGKRGASVDPCSTLSTQTPTSAFLHIHNSLLNQRSLGKIKLHLEPNMAFFPVSQDNILHPKGSWHRYIYSINHDLEVPSADLPRINKQNKTSKAPKGQTHLNPAFIVEDDLSASAVTSGGYSTQTTHEKRKPAVKTSKEEARRRTAILLSSIFLVYLVSWLPFFLVFFGRIPSGYSQFMQYCLFINNISSPFIYHFSRKDFRQDAKQLLRKGICRS